MQLFGTGMPMNKAEAEVSFRLALEKGSADAMFNLAQADGNGIASKPTPAERIALLRRAAALERNSLAQSALGLAFENGTERDPPIPVRPCYEGTVLPRPMETEPRRPTSDGRTEAAVLGVAQDYTEAARWYRSAVTHGIPNAAYRLAQIYEFGLGVTRDDAQAVVWWRKAVALGDAGAAVHLGRAIRDGLLGLDRDDETAVGLFRQAADSGNATGQGDLGFMYQSGRGVPKDAAAAVVLYRKAADQGDAYAQGALGHLTELGIGIPRDPAAARALYRAAAAQGNATAQSWLGQMLNDNEATAAEGAVWLRKAAEQGETTAQYNLSAAYPSGQGGSGWQRSNVGLAAEGGRTRQCSWTQWSRLRDPDRDGWHI